MGTKHAEVVVAGHICLDIIPVFGKDHAFKRVMVPGNLVEVNDVKLSTGGVVSNTGIALNRLGNDTELMGKVADDEFGKITINLLEKIDPAIAKGMVISSGEKSSYSIVLTSPDVDRIFLHHPGTNHTFQASDIDYESVSKAKLFHFGYPSLMKRMYKNEGEELVGIFKEVKKMGVITSLDMAMPDVNLQVDWRAFLKNVMPYVDIFLPSLDELLFMLRRDEYETLISKTQGKNIIHAVPERLLTELGDELLQLGSKITAIKLGDAGLYFRTSSKGQLDFLSPEQQQLWASKELWSPCYKVKAVGTTGAGDATNAGFLAALLRDYSPSGTLKYAVAVGAFSVEQFDATSGIPNWGAVQNRIQSGWEQSIHPAHPRQWQWMKKQQLWAGPLNN